MSFYKSPAIFFIISFFELSASNEFSKQRDSLLTSQKYGSHYHFLCISNKILLADQQTQGKSKYRRLCKPKLIKKMKDKDTCREFQWKVVGTLSHSWVLNQNLVLPFLFKQNGILLRDSKKTQVFVSLALTPFPSEKSKSLVTVWKLFSRAFV